MTEREALWSLQGSICILYKESFGLLISLSKGHKSQFTLFMKFHSMQFYRIITRVPCMVWHLFHAKTSHKIWTPVNYSVYAWQCLVVIHNICYVRNLAWLPLSVCIWILRSNLIFSFCNYGMVHMKSQCPFPFHQLKSIRFLRKNEMARTHLRQEPLKAITRFVDQEIQHWSAA